MHSTSELQKQIQSVSDSQTKRTIFFFHEKVIKNIFKKKKMNSALVKYTIGEATPAEVLRNLEIEFPAIYFNEIMNGVGRREVEKVLSLIPATQVFIEIDATWDGEEETLAGLMAGRYIEEISISGCNHEIRELPQSTKKILVRARENCAAIRHLAAKENIREIKIVGGKVDHRTWKAIANRFTKIQRFELNGTTLTDMGEAHEAMQKIDHFETRQAIINGVEHPHAGVINRMFEQYRLHRQ